MNYHVMTLFPEMINQALDTSIMGRAREKGLIHLNTINIRDFSENKHNRVDDYPYGGGAGMVMAAGPVYRTFEHVMKQINDREAKSASAENDELKNGTVETELKNSTAAKDDRKDHAVDDDAITNIAITNIAKIMIQL